MFKALRSNLLLVFLLVQSLSMVHAQDEYYTPSPTKPKLDSSLIYSRVKSHYYIRAEATTTRIHSRFTGDQFYSVAPFGLNVKGGLIAGFHYRGKWEVETGLKRLGIYASYRFDQYKSFGAAPGSFDGLGLNISYWNIPVTGKVVVWRRLEKFNLLGTMGIGYNWQGNDGISFAGPIANQVGIGMPDGSMLTYTTRETYSKKSSFVTGEVGIELNWFFLRKLGLTVATKRLFGPSTVLDLESQLVEDTQGTTFQFSSQTGANGTSVIVGLRYRLY